MGFCMPRRPLNTAAVRDILRCSSYPELLEYLRHQLKDRNLDHVARRLGYRSKGTISMFLCGRRTITRRGLAVFAKYLSWTEIQRLHVEKLLQRHIDNEIFKTRPSDGTYSEKEIANQVRLNPSQFSVLSAWYRLPLFFLISSSHRFPGFSYLERKLRHKVTIQELMSSVYALECLGFIERQGSSIRTKIEPYLAFSSEGPSQSIQEFHRAMLQRANEALTEQSIEERNFQALVLSMDRSKIPEAKQIIDQFIHTFNQHFRSETSTEVCQLNLQLFWHTDHQI